MLTGAIVTNDTKSISAVKPSRGSGQTRARRKRGGHNVIWKRITAAYDEDLRKLGANPAMVAPITRWVLFQHLTSTQGMAGRRYAAIVRKFERYQLPPIQRTARSANLEPTRGIEDQELEQRIANGSMDDYEEDARYAKRQYRRAIKVLDRFADRTTGRNFAKDVLDDMVLRDIEPDARYRPDIAAVLTAIAKEFGIGEKRRKVT